MTLMNLNLLPSKAKFQAAKIKLQSTVIKIVIGISTIWALALVTILGLNIYANYRIKAANIKLEKAKDNYTAMTNNIATSQILKYRAKIVGGVLKDRFEYGQAFEIIQNMFPQEVLIKSQNLREDGTFVIEGTTVGKENVDMIEKIVININNGQDLNLRSARLTSLALINSNWKFGLEVTLK